MAVDDSVTLAALADRYYEAGDKARKGASYLRAYTGLLAHRRRQKLRILELGVSSGASLLCWRDYLPNAIIVGIDINESPPRILGQDGIHFLRGSQDDPAVLDQAAAAAGGTFDLIVDDASHLGYLTKRSLNYLFPRWLAPGGCYVIEDFGTGFFADFPDGRDFAAPDCNDAIPGTVEFRSSQHGVVGVVKQLIEPLMHELMTGIRPSLAIERLTIETNIVFIEKSMQSSGPPPVPVPVPAAAAAGPREPSIDSAAARLEALCQAVKQHEERLAQVEQILARLQ